MRRKRRWLAALLLLALVLSLPLLVNLEVFRRQVERALARQLGREVEFVSLTARLLPQPGVVVRQVKIAEQEGFGDEPFLYAEEVQCDLPVRLLWTGRLDCSRIHFLRPSINLVRSPDHAWNLAVFLLLPGPPGGRASPRGRLPVISASDGRINFKLGVNKQVYALAAVRLSAEAIPGARWRLWLEATPVRGDRRLTETGTLRVAGELGQAAAFSAVPFRFQLSLDRGSLTQLVAFLSGREPPLRARASLAAEVEGTPEDWKAWGTVSLAELRHRDLVASPRSPRWESEFKLSLADGGRAVLIDQLILRGAHSELAFAGRVDDPFGQPRWGLQVSGGRVGFDELMAQWSNLVPNIPPDVRLGGEGRLLLKAEGTLGDWQGELTAPEGVSLRAPGLPQPVEFAGVRLRLGGGRLELAPLAVRFAPEQVLTVDAEASLLAAAWPYRVRWRSQGVDLEGLQNVAAAFGWAVFGPERWQGRARLEVEWRGEARGEGGPAWRGRAELQRTRFHPREVNQPVEISEARLAWEGNRVRVEPLVMRLGENPVRATLERRGQPARWQANLSAGELELADLDELFNPARRGLLARLVGEELPRTPRWADLAVVGELRVEELVAGPLRLRQVQAQGRWEAGQVELSRLRFRAYGGRFDGRLQGDFRSSPPRYRLAGNLKQLELAGLLADTTELGALFSGMAGADLTLHTAGTRPRDLRRQLQGRVVGVLHDGTIRHINLLAAMEAAAGEGTRAAGVAAGTDLQSLAGDFRVADQQVELDAVNLIIDGAALEVSGRVGFDGSLELRLSGEPLPLAGRAAPAPGGRLLTPSYRLTGTLRQPKVERVGPPPSAPPPRQP